MRLSSQSGRMNRVVRISAAILLVALLVVNTQAAVIRRATDKESGVTNGGTETSAKMVDVPFINTGSSKESTTKDPSKETASKETASKETGNKETENKETKNKEMENKETTNGSSKTPATNPNTTSNDGASKVPSTSGSETTSSKNINTATNAATNDGTIINVSTGSGNVVSGDKTLASASASASAASTSSSKNSNSGLSTMTITCIAVGGVILASVVGIFVLRKLKFTNTSRRARLEAPGYIRERSNSSDAAFLRHLRN